MKKRNKVMFLIYFLLIGLLLFISPNVTDVVNALDYVACGSAKGIPKPIPQATTIAYTLLMVGAPIVLIASAIMTLIKASSRNDADEMLKAKNKLLKKFLIAGIVFLTSTIVQFVITRVTSTSDDKTTLATCIKCFISYNNDDCIVSKTENDVEEGTYTDPYDDLAQIPFSRDASCGGKTYSTTIKGSSVEPADDVDIEFHWPLPMPYNSVGSSYGCRINPGNQFYGQCLLHAGLDLNSGGNSCVPIYAAADGYVSATQTSNWGCGNNVTITHEKGYQTRYCHQTKFIVEEGQKVKQGELIGFTGDTGNVSGPHLHFEVYKDGATTNPKKYFKLGDLSVLHDCAC